VPASQFPDVPGELAIHVTAAVSRMAPDTLVRTHRFNYESDYTKGGTWFGNNGVRLCDWSWDGEKKILTVRRARYSEEIRLSVDVERYSLEELGKQLSQAALEATQR
jgi:hypothetical protein